MAESVIKPFTEPVEVPLPDVEHLVTEDDTPVDNLFSEKQQVLLTRSLNTSWPGRREDEPFLVVANVGLYYSVNEPPLVPDVMLSLGVRLEGDIWQKRKRTYFVWEFGKTPEVVIEIVSNTAGGEAGEKMARYARAGIAYYAIFDPLQQIQAELLKVYRLDLPLRTYEPVAPGLLPGVELGLTLWQGEYDGWQDTWLRWTDAEGRLVPTDQEALAQQRRALDEQRRALDEQRRALDEQRRQAEEERRRAERLAAKLRDLGVDPDSH